MSDYRYKLKRQVNPDVESIVLWVMLNPSTADDMTDDPTIRKCKGFTEMLAYDTRLEVWTQ